MSDWVTDVEYCNEGECWNFPHSPSPTHSTPPPPPTTPPPTHTVYYFVISYEFFKLKKARLLFFFSNCILYHWKTGQICVWNSLNFNYCDPRLLYLMNISFIFISNWIYCVFCVTGKLAGYVYQIVWISIIVIQYFHSNTYIIQKFWMLKCTFLFLFFLNVYTCWLIIDWSDLESESSNFDK